VGELSGFTIGALSETKRRSVKWGEQKSEEGICRGSGEISQTTRQQKEGEKRHRGQVEKDREPKRTWGGGQAGSERNKEWDRGAKKGRPL